MGRTGGVGPAPSLLLLRAGRRRARLHGDAAAAHAGAEGNAEDAAGALGVADDAAAALGDAHGNAQDAARESFWYFNTARLCRTLTPRMTQQLLKGGDTIKGFIEWCDTPWRKAKGVVYADRAVQYDVDGVNLILVDQLMVF